MKTSVRHAEKRRTSTCRFADRIAQFCVQHFKQHIPSSFREEQKQTCLAAIVAFVEGNDNNSEELDNGCIYMLGMGVGTKFLPNELLDEEIKLDHSSCTTGNLVGGYGRRVRDCHAEVLAKRAFQRQILLTMLQDLNLLPGSPDPLPILRRVQVDDNTKDVCYGLRPGVSLHMYTSSAPCGNATLKKFATMTKEIFQENLADNEWPKTVHEPILGHSIPLGQFALLVKKERIPPPASKSPPSLESSEHNSNLQKRKPPKDCPATQSTDWCPPGTSTVWSGQGTIHTCSDKICRWNCLGLQGSLLASLLEHPLKMATLTVGRKLTESVCRRAVCCRASAGKRKKNKQKMIDQDSPPKWASYQVNHPTIMGTSVYMDDSGVIETPSPEKNESNGDNMRVEGQDVRFHSTLSWAWWPFIEYDNSFPLGYQQKNGEVVAECIDGATGLVAVVTSHSEQEGVDTSSSEPFLSRVSTVALVDLYCQVAAAMVRDECKNTSKLSRPKTLVDLRAFKRQTSPVYEAQKEELLTKHPLFRQWKRRENKID
ncbi:stranded RNA-specific editase B2 [Seminavis robusta]|uniref:Stranded RNA-specific editase B2 n=1 Tax=Seminavis robusta TaxID=568900 RepID=A0A9N8ETP4_9STRA|nr:stranded RNA-specific editase B2 [Seminavis robusta]|eukprot:Sro1658_g289140.1 stranded RNA-specific editase B2 (541) ;mRNA; f:7871-9597